MDEALTLIEHVVHAGDPDAVVEVVGWNELRVSFTDGTRVLLSVSVYA